MKDISEERKRQIELELVDMADALIKLTEEVGVGLEIHTSINEDTNKIKCVVYQIFHKKEKNDKYISVEPKFIDETNASEINPLQGFLDFVPDIWTKINKEEDA